jgi:hypothetical protein
MAKPEVKSFEIAEYSPAELDTNTAYKTIRQIVSDWRHEQANQSQHAVWFDYTGDKLKVHYHAYEMLLPHRLQEVERQANDIVNSAVKLMKAEFRKRTGAALQLAEVKELAGDTVEKVSLNERYVYKCWRFYTVSF